MSVPDVIIKSTSIQNVELQLEKIHTVSEAARLPFTLEDATRSEAEFEKVLLIYMTCTDIF